MKAILLEPRVAAINTSVLVVDLEGSLDVNSVKGFDAILTKLFKEGRYKIALNLEKVTYISSAGIGVLMSNIKHFRNNRGDIKLCNVPSEVYKVFDLLEIPATFQLHKTEQEAVKAF